MSKKPAIILLLIAALISGVICCQRTCYAAEGIAGFSTTQDAAAQNTYKKVGTGYVLASTSTSDSTEAAITSVEATDQDGNDVTVDIADVSGLTSDWLTAAGYDADTSTVKVTLDDSGAVTKLSVYNEDGDLVCSYNPDSHQMSFYYTSGDLKGKIEYITAESTRDYTWRYSDYDREDPGKGTDGHNISQYYNYDSDGNLTSVEYFTWTAGNSPRRGDAAMYSRYMYRVDTYADGELTDTTYYNDPRPTYWDPTLTGTVVQDSEGRYFLKADDGTMYLLTTTMDGFDADGDNTSGADEMSEIDWSEYVGETITVRGQQITDSNNNEIDIYYEGEQAQGFEVVDIVEDGETLIDGWEDIAEAVDEAWASLNTTFTKVEDETDVNISYARFYSVLAGVLKEKGLTSSDISKYGDAGMQAAWAAQGYTSASSLSSQSLSYLDSGDWSMSLAFAVEILTHYTDTADTQEAALSAYPEDEDANSELNAVGIAHWVLANYYANLGNTDKETEHLNAIIDSYKYSYMLSTSDNETWLKIAERAQEMLDALND